MRIAVLTSLYPGASRPYQGIFAERRWLGMKARGHEVRVVQPLPRTPGFLSRGNWAEIRALSEREERGGIEILRPRYFHVPRRARANAKCFARAGWRGVLERGLPDVVVADYAWPAAAAASRVREQGVPFVISGRGSDVLEVAGEAGLGGELAAALRCAGHWCAVSEDLVAAMDRLAGSPGVGRLVPNGIDLDLFRPGDREAARRNHDLPAEPRVVLVVGHLIARKDPSLALEAFQRGAPSDALCVFLGRGPMRTELDAQVRELGLAARVLFAGEVAPQELAGWYAAADCLLLTSSREGRPNVVLEALASGRPAVATAAGGTAECLAGWEEELLVEDRSAAAVAEKLARVLAEPPSPEDLRASVAHLSWDRSLDALERCLEDACGADA